MMAWSLPEYLAGKPLEFGSADDCQGSAGRIAVSGLLGFRWNLTHLMMARIPLEIYILTIHAYSSICTGTVCIYCMYVIAHG